MNWRQRALDAERDLREIRETVGDQYWKERLMENKRLTMRQLEQRKQVAEQELQNCVLDWATCSMFNPLEKAAAKKHLEDAGAKYRSALHAIEIRRVRDKQ